jgi:HD-GYP domain-containing protein (c-di-GMP phosphodiesterase class II)
LGFVASHDRAREESAPEGFEAVPLAVLRTPAPRDFPVYRRTHGRCVLLARSGETLTRHHLVTLEESGTTVLYVAAADRPRVFALCADTLSALVRDRGNPARGRDALEGVYQAVVWSVAEAFRDPTLQTVQHGAAAAGYVLEALAGDARLGRALVVRARDDATRPGHSLSVSIMGTALARSALSLVEADLSHVAVALMLHDIGLSTLPSGLLDRAGPLTPREWDQVHSHPATGLSILRRAGQSLGGAAPIVTQHHERYDGAGYPMGLGPGQIHPLGQIGALADAFAALTADRPYRGRSRALDALFALKSEVGSRYDPELYRQFVMLFAGEGPLGGPIGD